MPTEIQAAREQLVRGFGLEGAKVEPKIARTRPELFEPLRAAGWRLAGTG